jgi:hypothetical protein
VVAAVLGCGVQTAWAWGHDGHSMINRLAAENLPPDVPAFLRNGNALDVLGWLAPEPDRWREGARGELVGAPDHFIDMEWAELAEVSCAAGTADCPASGTMLPTRRYDFIRALAATQPKNPSLPLTPEKVGLLPWQTAEIFERLRVDFRQYRQMVAANQDVAPVETAILFDAGWLGHFAGDGSQPLHTTIQYNGWTGANPNGYTTEHKIHSLFESAYVAANIKASDLTPLVSAAQPQVIDDEWAQYMEYLKHTNGMVEKVYQLEKAGGFTGSGTPEAKTFTDERLAAGAIELRDLIYSAWVHSADPVEEYRGPQ